MKKLYLISLIAVMFLMSLSFVSADSANACKLDVSIVNQDPYPAIPDSYVDIVFQVSGVQNAECGGARFELVPNYPFSLDTNDTSRILSGGTFISESKNEWMISYKIRVDTNALDGNSILEVHYAPGTSGADSYTIKKFDIAIKDSRTTFDAVIQEISGSDVSIAIANTGKYTANSVVVRIPEQTAFKVIGTDGQMVGNLESGDYTIVGFSVSPTMQAGFQYPPSRDIKTDSQNLSNKLKFEIYYTDNIGERRIVNMELPLNIAGNSSLQNGNFALRKSSANNNSFWSKWYNWVIIIVVILLLFGLYNKYKSWIKANIFGSHNKKNASDRAPDWIRNSKEKEKNK